MQISVFKKVFMFSLLISVFLGISINNETKVFAATPSIGTSYSSLSNVPAPVNSRLGNPSTTATKYTSYQEKKVSNNIGWTHDTNWDDYATEVVVIYKFPVRVNMTIERYLESYRFLGSGVSYSYEVTHTVGETFTYETSATVSLSLSYENSTTLEVGVLDFGNVGDTVTTSVESTVSSTISYSHIKTYTSTVTEHYSVTPSSSSYYMFETRGIFYAYVVQVFSINYDSTKTHHGLPWVLGYDTWEYTISDYTLTNQYVLYSYISNTATTGLYKYYWNGYAYAYNDAKYTGITYY